MQNWINRQLLYFYVVYLWIKQSIEIYFQWFFNLIIWLYSNLFIICEVELNLEGAETHPVVVFNRNEIKQK